MPRCMHGGGGSDGTSSIICLNGPSSEIRGMGSRICGASTQQYGLSPLSWGVNNSNQR